MKSLSSKNIELIDSIPMGICIINKDFVVLQWNRIFAQWTNILRNDIVGSDIREHFPNIRHIKYENRFREIFKGGPPIIFSSHLHNFLIPSRLPDGKFRIQHTIISALSGAREQFDALITANDITQLNNQVEDYRKLHKFAENANRSKTEFLSSMSHELRTPLNSIIGFSQVLDLELEDPDQKESVGFILKAGNHLLELINDVLDLAKIESGKTEIVLEEINFLQSIDDVIDLVYPLAKERNIVIKNNFAKNKNILVQADSIRLKQVLMNLLSNAIKYNKNGGSVNIDYELMANEKIRIKIADTGTGIPPERERDLFNPFNRLGEKRSRTKGTGIGLTISKKLIELMNGQIGFQRHEEQGCTFWIELQVKEVSIDSDMQKEKLCHPRPANTPDKINDYTLLYIEDDPDNLKLVGKILNKIGNIKYIFANNARLGIELSKLHKPDIILLDITLPEMDGYEVLNLLQDNVDTQKIPVIAVSAHALKTDVDKGLKAGFAHYITKPFSINGFLNTITEILKSEFSAGDK